MEIQTQYITTVNSYAGNEPCAIIVHNTGNFAKTATAKSHASGLKDGVMNGISWHIVVDDKEAYQCLPFNRGAYHVGVNYGGKLFGKINNRNSIGVEMCVNAGYDYEKAFHNTVEVVKWLMQELGIPADRVYQHWDICGKDCPQQIRQHGDWPRFKQLIGGTDTVTDIDVPVVVDKYFRIRTSWADSASQLGAYEILDNAINSCPYPYSIYDWNGNVVYSAPKPAGGTQSADFNGLTEAQCAEKILDMAYADSKKSHILPGLTAAQAILESGHCRTTELVRKSNNCFGMKCTLSGNTWATAWDGSSKVNIRTQEQDKNGNPYYIYADFRKYPNIEKSFEDHSCYLLGAMNGSKLRYAGLTECWNAKQAVQLVKNGGYATDKDYVSKLMDIISRYKLDRYDAEIAGLPVPVQPVSTPTPEPAAKVHYRVQVGCYSDQANVAAAKKKLKDYDLDSFTETDSAGTHVYCGSFSYKANAEKRLAIVRSIPDFDRAYIKEAA